MPFYPARGERSLAHCTKKDPAYLSFALIHHPKQYTSQSWYYNLA